MNRSALAFVTLVAVAIRAIAQQSGCGGLEGKELAECKRNAPVRGTVSSGGGPAHPIAPPPSAAFEAIQAAERAKNDERKRLANAPYMPTIGMTLESARESQYMRNYCDESKVNKTTTATHEHEQWVCVNKYFYFDNGVLTAIQE